MATEQMAAREGTLSCFLALIRERGQPEIKVALTSHHVLFRGDATRHKYKPGTREPKKFVLMPGTKTWETLCNEANFAVEVWKDHGKNPTECVRAENFNSHLKTLETPASRRLGHILYSPPLTPVLSSDGSPGYLPDYAIIALDATRLGYEYDGLTNAVYVGQVGSETLRKVNQGFPAGEFQRIRPNDDGLLKLRGIIPIHEIMSPRPEDRFGDGVELRVGKCSRTTGLTYGVSNGVESVVRMDVDGRNIECLQWLIVSSGVDYFSRAGDSGACIWDLRGRVGGILDAGSGGLNGRHDVTYATPMAVILDHIKNKGRYYSANLL